MAKVAKATVRVAGHRDLIRRGSVYQDDDPVVTRRPDLFEDPAEQADRLKPALSTAELGERSMSARKRPTSDVETARSAPGEVRDMGHSCGVEGCDYVGTSERALKTHATKVHG